MRPAATHHAHWIAAIMLAAASATAAPIIEGWEHDTDGLRERVTLKWSESGAYDITQFPEARQIIAVLPHATLTNGIARRFGDTRSSILDGARLQEVTLANGIKGIQLTFNLNEWVEVESEATDDGFALSYLAPEDDSTSSQSASPDSPSSSSDPSKSDGLVFTNEKIEEMKTREYGSWDAPPTGAGQGEETSLADYYVPPSIEEDASNQSDERLEALNIESRLNEVVARVDLQGSSLENVVRLISEQAEINLLVTPADVAGRTVTIRLRNVTLRQMLDAILKANNLGYVIEDGGILRIVPRNQVRTSERETITETISINWVDAAEVAASLTPFIDETDGMLQVSQANNSIIVRDVPENLTVIQDLVSRIDVPEKQVMIELRLVNMTESARRAIGSQTEFRANETRNFLQADESGSVGTISNNQTNSINQSLTNSSSNSNSSGFSSTDTNTGRTFSRNNSSSSSNAASSALGAAATATSNLTQTQDIFSVADGSFGLLEPTAEAFGLATRGSLDIFGRDFDVAFAINAQEERGEAITLASPTVLSLNNTPSRVEIQRQIPYVSAVNSDEGSVGTVEFKEIGTSVDVTPRITNNGYVIMNVQPEQIIDTGERPQGVPVTDERRVEASVIVKDETTIALGGLRQFESTSSEAGVPYLLRVPVLSWMFKNQTNSQNRTELYLFVTPHIVKDPTPTLYQQSLYDKIDHNWDLPDYFFDDVVARSAPGEDQRDPR